MRIAFVGKGGAGKSSLAGTCARLLAARGERVLALDSDPMPGLAVSLGIALTDAGIPDEAVEAHEEGGRTSYQLRAGLSAAAAVERYAGHGPDGVRYLQLGKARGVRGENLRSHHAFQRIVDGLADTDWSVVGDLPGGTRQAFFGWGRYARTLLVVVEPTAASALSARRLAGLRQMPGAPRLLAVANKVREAGDADLIAHHTGLPVIAAVPFDPAQADADRTGAPLLDVAPDAKAVAAVASLVSSLLAEERAA